MTGVVLYDISQGPSWYNGSRDPRTDGEVVCRRGELEGTQSGVGDDDGVQPIMIAPFFGPFSLGGVSEEFLAAVKGASFAFVNKSVFVPDLRHLLGCHYLLLNVRSVAIAGQCRGRLPLTADEESAVFQSIARGRDPQSFSLAGGEVMMVRCRTSRVRHT